MTAPMVAPVEARFKATGISEVQRGLRLVGSAGETTGRQVGGSMRQIAGGVEMIARQGKVTGESLKSIIAQGAEMAFMFGAAGPIVGAIGIVGVAIYEHITNRMKEAREEAEKVRVSLENLGRGTLGAAGGRQKELYSGDRASIRKEGESAAEYRGRLLGIEGVERRMATVGRSLPSAVVARLGDRPASDYAEGSSAREYRELMDVQRRLRPEYEKLLQITADLALAEGQRLKTGLALAADERAKVLAIRTGEQRNDFMARFNAGPSTLQNYRSVNAIEGVRESLRGVGGPSVAPIIKTAGDRLAAEFHENVFQPTQDVLRQGMSSTIGDSISQGIREGFQQGSIGTALAAGGKALLSGIGQMIQQEGEVWIKYGVLKLALFDSLFKDPVGSGASAIAKGGLLVALGASISSVWGGRGGGGSSGGGGGSYSASAITHYGNIDPTISGASGITPRNAVANYVTIIGTDSPEAQRAFDELQRKSRARGSLG